MDVLGAIVCIAFFFLVLHDFQQRLPAGQSHAFRRWLLTWAAKGLLAPLLLWIIFDGGIFESLPPFTPIVEVAKLGGRPFEGVCDAAALGLFIIGSYWAGITSIWLLSALAQRTESQSEFRGCVLVWSAGLGPMALLMVHYLGWQFAGVAAALWTLPIVQRVLAIQPDPTVKPVYSNALAKLHFDKHAEAEAAVLQELEKCENDFDGWMFLADLYANHFHDLPGAEGIIRDTCEHPDTNASQVAVAFHRLADWHLKLADDPAAARRDLWEICRRHPKSHLDRMARLRLEQIPASKEELTARRTPRAFALPTHPGESSAEAAGAEAFARAKRCLEELRANPNNYLQRENLARIFATELEAVDRGLEQLDLLLAAEDAPEKKPAQWRLLRAVWLLEQKQDPGSARKSFEEILRLHPNTQEAFAARSRLGLMDGERRLRELRDKINGPAV